MNKLHSVVESFRANANGVRRLMEFDRFVLDIAIQQLETLEERNRRQWTSILKTLPRAKDQRDEPELNPALSVRKTINVLQGIREHDSLRPHYQLMTNQALVLLVSYFGSAVRDLIRASVLISIGSGINPEIQKFEIKVRVDELSDLDGSIEEFVAERVVNSPDISYQDMRSIGRALKTYFAYDHPRDASVNDIIAGQACRHAIVHSGLEADARLINQLKSAVPRAVKRTMAVGDRIQFAAEEVVAVEAAMIVYLSRATRGLEEALGLV